MPSKIQRTSLSIKQKHDILNQLQSGMSANKLARQYSVHRSTITRIKHNHKNIKEFVCETEVGPGNRKSLKAAEFPKMEKVLYK